MLLSSGIDPQQKLLWPGVSREVRQPLSSSGTVAAVRLKRRIIGHDGRDPGGGDLEGWTCHRPVSLSGDSAPKNNARMIAIPSVRDPEERSKAIAGAKPCPTRAWNIVIISWDTQDDWIISPRRSIYRHDAGTSSGSGSIVTQELLNQLRFSPYSASCFQRRSSTDK